jgi:hypothetical protein
MRNTTVGEVLVGERIVLPTNDGDVVLLVAKKRLLPIWRDGMQPIEFTFSDGRAIVFRAPDDKLDVLTDDDMQEAMF